MQGGLSEGAGAVGVAGVGAVGVKCGVVFIFCSMSRNINASCIRAHVLCLLLVRLEGIRSLLVRLLCSASVLVKQ